jgi:hypothetical protein
MEQKTEKIMKQENMGKTQKALSSIRCHPITLKKSKQVFAGL